MVHRVVSLRLSASIAALFAALLCVTGPTLCAGDLFLDVVTTDADGLWVFRGDGEGGFLPPESLFIADGVEAWSVAVGDLDGDELPEIVSANRLAAHVTIFKNGGDAGFAAEPKILTTPDRPYDVDLGDLDGDGDLDIVATCNFDPGAVVLFFNDGKGEFPDRETLTPGGETFNSVLVDLDQKNGVDLVVSLNADDQVALYHNLGDGSLTPSGTVDTGDDPKALVAADFTGDGFPDVALVNDAAGRVTILQNDEQGGLSRGADYSAGVQPRELTAVSLDAGGTMDLVVAGGRGSNFVARFLGNGDGTFLGPVDYATGPRPNSVDSGDVDRDGLTDVVVANWSLDDPSLATVSVLYGDGTGELGRKRDFAPPGGFEKVTALAIGQLTPPLREQFVRGDPLLDGTIDITDGIETLNYLFLDGKLKCLDAADTDDNGKLEITDAILLLNSLFIGGRDPAPPYPNRGVDPTEDALDCKGV